MTRSEDVFRRSKDFFPGGVNSPVRYFRPNPVVMESGHGSRIVDVDGNEYIDYCLGYGPLILGHSHPSVTEAISDQVQRTVLLGTPSQKEVNLAEKIREAIPSMEKMRFVNSGTEATMHALRLARAFTGRSKIVKMEGCFHGSHDYVLIKSGSGTLTHGVPSSPGIPEAIAETVAVARFNDIESVKEIFDREAEGIAAVITEPVMANVGLIPPDPGFLRELRKITSDHGSLLIFDEVVTGFRFHYGSYSGMAGITPDITTLGKIPGGGMPIGVYGGREEIMDNISPAGGVYQAGTFSGNPVTMSAGLAALSELKKLDYSILARRTASLSTGIKESMEENGIEVAVNSMISMMQFFPGISNARSYGEVASADASLYFRIFSDLLSHGVYLAPSQFETNFLSFSHSDSDISETLECLRKVIPVAKDADRGKRK